MSLKGKYLSLLVIPVLAVFIFGCDNDKADPLGAANNAVKKLNKKIHASEDAAQKMLDDERNTEGSGDVAKIRDNVEKKVGKTREKKNKKTKSDSTTNKSGTTKNDAVWAKERNKKSDVDFHKGAFLDSRK